MRSGRVEQADRAIVRALVDQMTRWSGTPILETVTPHLQSLLRAEIGCSYRIGLGTNAWQLDFAHMRGGPPSMVAHMERFLATSAPPDPARVTGYHLIHPPRDQRNRAVRVVAKERMEVPLFREVFVPLRIDAFEHLRALVCDGDLLLGWVGAIGPRFGPRERTLLNALVTPMRARLTLERALATADVYARGLEAALDSLDVAAFLVRGEGQIMAENAVGRMLRETRVLDLKAQLRAARAGADPGGVMVVPLATRGDAGYALVTVRSPGSEFEGRVARATRCWRLTARQVQVLRHLARGEANKTIAERLGCARITVEVHVSSLLRAAGAESRAALVAKFWAPD